MQKPRIKVSLPETTFLMGYLIYIVTKLTNTSMLYEKVSQTFLGQLRWIVIIFAAASVMLHKKLPKETMIKMGISVFVGFIVYTKCQSIDFLCTVFLLIASYEIDIRKIFKLSLLVNIVFLVLIPVLYFEGYLPDNTYSHINAINSTVSLAHSYGYLHYSNAQFIILYSSLLILYLRNFSWILCALLTAVNITAFSIFTAKLPLIIFLITVVTYIVFENTGIMENKKNFWRAIATITPIFLFVITLAVTKIYNSGNNLITYIDLITRGRINFGYIALNKYGLNLFGHKIQMYGSFSLEYGGATTVDYFYIDNDYLYITLAYGLLIMALIMILYILMLRVFVSQNNKMLYVWGFMSLTFALINSTLLIVEYNPLVFVGFSIWLKSKLNIEKLGNVLNKRKRIRIHS